MENLIERGRRCVTCKKTKAVTEFTGLRVICKECSLKPKPKRKSGELRFRRVKKIIPKIIPNLNCSFCGKEITRDRYNISVDVEREDIPYETDWEKVNEIYREDVCSKCENLIMSYFRHIVDNIRKNKGEYKPDV